MKLKKLISNIQLGSMPLVISCKTNPTYSDKQQTLLKKEIIKIESNKSKNLSFNKTLINEYQYL